MTAVVISVAFGLVMIVMSLWANRRFQQAKRLPMQWSITGSVNWTAPRALALSFIPAVAIFVFATVIVMKQNFQVRAGQEGQVIPTLIFIGILFVAIQFLHFWLIARTLHRNDR